MGSDGTSVWPSLTFARPSPVSTLERKVVHQPSKLHFPSLGSRVVCFDGLKGSAVASRRARWTLRPQLGGPSMVLGQARRLNALAEPLGSRPTDARSDLRR